MLLVRLNKIKQDRTTMGVIKLQDAD